MVQFGTGIPVNKVCFGGRRTSGPLQLSARRRRDGNTVMTPQVNIHRTDTPTPHPPRNARRVWLADPVRHTQTGMRPTTHRRATRAGSGRGISSSLNIAATSKMLFFRYKFDHRAVSLRGSLRDAQRVAGAAEIPNHDNAEAHPPTPQEQTGRGKGRRKVWSNEVNVNILHGTLCGGVRRIKERQPQHQRQPHEHRCSCAVQWYDASITHGQNGAQGSSRSSAPLTPRQLNICKSEKFTDQQQRYIV